MIFILISHIFINEVNAVEQNCDWKILNPENLQEISINKLNSKTNYYEVNLNNKPTIIDCNFSNNINLENQLLYLEFLASSLKNYEIKFNLIDYQGNIISSKSIGDWYDIPPNEKASIALYPQDFKPIGKFYFNQVENFQINIISEIDSIRFSDLNFSEIQTHPNFSPYDNLPIQSTLPGFLSLILISFPIGFVVVYSTNFLQTRHFFEKLPWILGIGFATYVILIFIVSLFWISFESVLTIIVLSYVLFILFVLKKRSLLSNSNLKKSKNLVIFYVIIFTISGILASSTIGSVGWPLDPNDGLGHGLLTSLTVDRQASYDGQNFLPIRDTPSEFLPSLYTVYPKGIHTASAGLTFLVGSFPAVSLVTVFSFIMFLIPLILTSIVYKFSNSILFSSLMFLFSFWRPETNFWYGDLVWNKWIGGLYASEIGILFTIISLFIIVQIFEKNNKKRNLLLPLSIAIFALFLSYYGFLILPIIVGIISSVIFFVRRNFHKVWMISLLTAFLGLAPFWRKIIGELNLINNIGVQFGNPSPHYKLLANLPFDPSGPLFPLWISSLIGLFSSFYLLRDIKYRYLSIVIIIISVIHLLAISEYVYLNHLYFYSSLRGLGLMLFLSIGINLILAQIIFKKIASTKNMNLLGKKRIILVKGIALFLITILIVPSFFQLYQDTYNINRIIKVPGGNEKNLHLWLYENTDSDDLILNDHSFSGLWYVGFRAQKMINLFPDIGSISRSYNPESKQFEPKFEAGRNVLKANEILKNPWDYEYIEKTLKELDIKYVYISERVSPKTMCRTTPESCYPDSQNWSWKNYDGNSRIGMYENHPNLELVIRNGNSAIFKVI